MSEEPKITSVEKTEGRTKTKDPRRVEAGKRLGAISKQAKERKAKERSERSDQQPDSFFENLGLIVGVVGTAVGIASIYFSYGEKSCQPKTETEPEQPKEPTNEPKTMRSTTKTKLDSFD